jgi:hypothetical protein
MTELYTGLTHYNRTGFLSCFRSVTSSGLFSANSRPSDGDVHRLKFFPYYGV